MRIDIETWKDVVSDIEEYIPRLIQASDSVSELMYDQVTPDGWGIVAQMLEGYENFYKSLYMTVEDAKDHDMALFEKLNKLVVKFPEQFVSLQQELEAGNHVAVGDMMKYEWTRLLAEVSFALVESKRGE
ncbi:hypothetical protein [Paenibacillus sp. PAMC21692]|uniref:hypothetical protein n=1 Tax=Paenibacillus sp. PAMC21692 TaxID=2762320 RepID=UPI00164D3F11|nr:hypothetical protein [Paenibacillus sp. PAMC21692]QNK58364.1 hypothetical protein H7F31_05375 [Paenibacillus sp. PAMC21692]